MIIRICSCLFIFVKFMWGNCGERFTFGVLLMVDLKILTYAENYFFHQDKSKAR